MYTRKGVTTKYTANYCDDVHVLFVPVDIKFSASSDYPNTVLSTSKLLFVINFMDCTEDSIT